MLFFELFPAFVALVGLVVGGWLLAMNRQADRQREGAPDALSGRPSDPTRRRPGA